MDIKVILFIYIFMVSACFGSFINVVVDRIVAGKSLGMKDRSHCESCGHVLGFFDLVPIFSYIFLGGKCRYCGTKYGADYLIVEIFFSLVGVGLFAIYGVSIEFLLEFILFIMLYIIYQVDNKTMEIPMWCNVVIFVLAIVNCIVLNNITIKSAIIGALAISLLLFIVNIIKKDSFGFGDIKLFFASGAYLGIKGVIVAYFIALITCVVKVIINRDKKDMRIPFGPFIAIGVFLSSIFGTQLINMYLNLF